VLYGTSFLNIGTVYAMNLDGSNLHDITHLPPPGRSNGGLILSGSTLYGTQNSLETDEGYGWALSVGIDGSNYRTLHSFVFEDGRQPQAGLTLVGSKLYGTASRGGRFGSLNDVGTAYSMNLDGSAFSVLHTFNGVGDGGRPFGNLIAVGSTIYGTTSIGGASAGGTAFSMKLDGSNFVALHSFAENSMAMAGLTLLGSKLYGTTSNTIYSMNLDGTGFQTLHTFTFDEGIIPISSLVVNGMTLYGTTNHIAFSIPILEPSSFALAALALIGVTAWGVRKRRA
jgi:uncharacterized repeat protein (TIGR03803 family)